MIKHHPDDNLLTEYASGSLALALGISVCAHLQLCPQCRKRVETLNTLGAVILTNSVAEKVEAQTFSQLMTRIRERSANELAEQKISTHKSTTQKNIQSRDSSLKNLPKVIAKLLPQDRELKWQRMSMSLKTARLITGQNEYEVAFQKISSGGKIVEHGHRGLEVTLVLQGSFSDEDGVYSEGDFLVRAAGEVHRPTATLDQDCLCLSVVAAPVAVTGFLGKVINPFLGFRPA